MPMSCPASRTGLRVAAPDANGPPAGRSWGAGKARGDARGGAPGAPKSTAIIRWCSACSPPAFADVVLLLPVVRAGVLPLGIVVAARGSHVDRHDVKAQEVLAVVVVMVVMTMVTPARLGGQRRAGQCDDAKGCCGELLEHGRWLPELRPWRLLVEAPMFVGADGVTMPRKRTCRCSARNNVQTQVVPRAAATRCDLARRMARAFGSSKLALAIRHPPTHSRSRRLE